MAIVFAIGGGIAIGGVIIGAVSDDGYSDYSYSNHSDYSDAAERARRRKAEQERELDVLGDTINSYKITQMNSYLDSHVAQRKGVEYVTHPSSLTTNAKHRMNTQEKDAIAQKNAQLAKQVDEIDSVISKINHVLEHQEGD